MLRDRYYLGIVTHQGIEYPGRHEALVTQEIFDRVQATLENRRLGGVRERHHNHYLKGTVCCHRCQRRLIITRGKNKQGIEYFYYRRRGRQDQSCDQPYLPVEQVEDAVLGHYSTLHIPSPVQDMIRTRMYDAHGEHRNQVSELQDQVKAKIAKLDRQEDGYLDLVGDPEWPREKISQRLRQIRDERERLRRQLANAEGSKIDAGREAIEILLDLLTEPRELYRLASKRARKVLNQAFFVRIYLDSGDAGLQIANDQLTEPVERIHTLENSNPGPSGPGLE